MAIIHCPHCGRECDLATGVRQCANCAGALPDASFAPGQPSNGLPRSNSTAVQTTPSTTVVRCPHCGRDNDTAKGIEYCLECGLNLPLPGAVQPDEVGRRAEELDEATRATSQLLLVGGALLLLFGAVSFTWATPDAPQPEETNEYVPPNVLTKQQRWEREQQQRGFDLQLAALAAVVGLAVAGLGVWSRTQPFEAALGGVAVLGLGAVAEVALVAARVENVCFGSTKVLILVYFLSLVLRACLRVNEIRQPV